MGDKPATGARLRAEQRRRRDDLAAQVLDQYREGADLPTIADDLGITPRRAASLFAYAVSNLPALDVDGLRGSVEVRLDKLASEARELATNATTDRDRVAALRELRSIEQQRARLLGLDRSTRR